MPKALAHKNSKGETFYLHSKVVHLRGNKPHDIFFMMKQSQLADAEKNNCTPRAELPKDYEIHENPRNNMLTVRRKHEGQMVEK